MMRMCRLGALVLVLLPIPASAQFALFRVAGNSELAVPPVYGFDTTYAGETTGTQFRLRNTSTAPALLSLLNAAGVGFSLTGPALPATVPPLGSVDFTVKFSAGTAGSYSANLEISGLSVLLTAIVAPSLTYTVLGPFGWHPLGSTAVDFGTVAIGSSATLHFAASNQAGVPLIVPAIGLQGECFAIKGASPSGTLLSPQQQSFFDIQCAPLTAGKFAGDLTIGDRTYQLNATAPPLPLPVPRLSIQLPQTGSGQQGSMTVGFDAPAEVSGSGTVTLDFQPEAIAGNDAALAFASGERSAVFTFTPGDLQARFDSQSSVLFQTGTTAGTLIFSATIGTATARQSVTIVSAPVSFTSVNAGRSTGGLSLQLVGYDNTQTAGSLRFTFFDSSGSPIPPGAISIDDRQAFLDYFATSNLGGIFRLNAQFPVTGDASKIRSVEVEASNKIGVTKTAIANF